MRKRNRVFGLFATAALAGSLMMVAAPAAQAAVIGGCSGLNRIYRFSPSLTAATQPVVLREALNREHAEVVHGIVPGFDHTMTDTNCAVVGEVASAGTNIEPRSLRLSGNLSCLPAASVPPAEVATQFPLHGKLGLRGGLSRVISTFIRATFDSPAGPDIIEVTGMVTKGPGVGASVSGSLAFDPVVNDAGTNHTSYSYDSSQIAAPCGSAGGAPIEFVYIGDGVSLLGNIATGLTFSF